MMKIKNRIHDEIAAVILAGGKATRMGGHRDKAFLKIDGEPIVTRQLKTLKKIFKEIIIVTNSVDTYKKIRGVRVISDIIPGRGPLSGIHAGLSASSHRHNFVVACDMPFINEALIRHTIENKNDYDVMIPRIDGKFHPLFGIYSKGCIVVIEEMLKHDRLKISNIFTRVKAHFISKSRMTRFDEKLFSLVNVNTKEDLAIADSGCYND